MKKILKRRAFYKYALRKPLQIMRWSLLLFIISIFQVQAITGFSQKSEFSLNFENASVATILSEIEDESNFYFMCNRKLINLDRIISIRVDNQPIEKILAEIFKGTDVEYIIKGRQIVLTAGKYNLPASEGSQQTRTVSGKVTDSAGNPLPGVSILIKGTAKGVITDAEGSYTIGNLTEKSILDFSFIGMQSQSIPVGNRTTINVNLSEATIGLDEVVAIGYGTTTKSRLISSMSTVKTDDFVDQPYTNLQSALAGRVSGVMVNAAGGQPGSVPSISVRGGEPLIGKTAPLYVIDGLIRSQDAFVALNPNDISEISFLKDALATAVYGAQASAGIVLVTTKQGIVGKPQITYSNNIAWNTPNLFPKLIDSYQKALVSNAISAASGNGNYSVYTKEQLEIIKNGTDLENYPNNNWYDLTFKKYALQQSHNLSITGGTNQIKYYVGLGYFNQGSNYVNDAETYQRFSYRTNITSTFEKNRP
ncbi:MAG: SusC/RagA family TonB-linked outer membrane protein [Mangrovibacterium sp.]